MVHNFSFSSCYSSTMAAFFASSLLLFGLSTMPKVSREFQFVDYGKSFESQRPTISCDGKVSGVTLELTHWTGSTTPDEYYADTSTEMALQLPDSVLSNALVLNNHYDTDGVLSVWACLEPALASRYADLLKEGAEAGDFGEWSSDLGIKLDSVISAMYSNDEEAAYKKALRELPNLLDDLKKTKGTAYKELWQPVLDHAYRSYDALVQGEAILKAGPGSITILEEPFSLSSYALHRGLVQEGLLDRTTRVLRVMPNSSGYSYRYEKPGHGWVQRLVDRKAIPSVDATKLVKQLNAIDGPSAWKTGGEGGLVAICFAKSLEKSPEIVVNQLYELDDGAQKVQK